MSGNFKNLHHVEPRVKLYSPREESFPIPLKYIDVSRTTQTNLDVKQERRIMIIGILMGQEFFWFLYKFHSVYSIRRETSRRIYVVRGEIHEKAGDIQARLFMARITGENGKECQAKGEAKVVTRKPSTR